MMQDTTDKRAVWKKRLEQIGSPLCLFAAGTAFLWVPLLMGEGSLSHRLMGIMIPLLFLLPGIVAAAFLFGLAYAALERHEEKERGELSDAKKY